MYAAVIVHYRDSPAVIRLLSEMESWTRQPVKCYVVDNSQDFPDLAPQAFPTEVFVQQENAGYAAAVNVGIRAAVRDNTAHLLILTQDATLEIETAERLDSTLATHPMCAIAAPVLAFASAPSTTFSAGGRLRRDSRATHIDILAPLTQLDRRGASEAEWADGACLMARVDRVVEAGSLDESYFLYVEEIDLMHRLRKNGFSVLIVREALAFQEPGRFTPYLRSRNSLYFLLKFRNDFGMFAVPRVVLSEVMGAMRARSRPTLIATLEGIRDAFVGRMGPPTKRAQRVVDDPRRNARMAAIRNRSTQ